MKKLARSPPDFPHTLFQPFVLKKYKKQWQAHLEKISDFLLPGQGSRWEHDSKQNQKKSPSGPVLHQFRSNSLKRENAIWISVGWYGLKRESVFLPTGCTLKTRRAQTKSEEWPQIFSVRMAKQMCKIQADRILKTKRRIE